MKLRQDFKGISSILYQLLVQVIVNREKEFRALVCGTGKEDYLIVVKRVRKTDHIVPETEVQMELLRPPNVDDIL